MKNKQITSDDIAKALINASENIGLCDEETAIGLKTSKKKDILKSKNAHLVTSQMKSKKGKQKNREDINNDN